MPVANGLGGQLSDAFGSTAKVGDRPGYGQNQANDDEERLRQQAGLLSNRAAVQANGADEQADYAGQQNVLKGLNDTISGNAPSVAQTQMQAGVDQSIRGQLAAAAGAKGGGSNQALAQINAMNSGAQTAANAVGQGAALRAGEIATARGQAAGLTTNMRGQSQQFALGQGNLALGSRQANDQASQGLLGLGQGYRKIAQEGDIANQQAQTQVALQNAQTNQGNATGIVGGLANAAASYFGSDEGLKYDVSDAGLGAGHYDARPRPQHHVKPGYHDVAQTPFDVAMAHTQAAFDSAKRHYQIAQGHRGGTYEPEDVWARTGSLVGGYDDPTAGRRHANATAQRLTDAASSRPFDRSGIDSEFRDMMRTPGSGRDYGSPTGGVDVRDDEDEDTGPTAEERAAEVDKRIGSPRIMSSEGAKMDISSAGSPDAGGGKDTGAGDGAKALGAFGSTFAAAAAPHGYKPLGGDRANGGLMSDVGKAPLAGAAPAPLAHADGSSVLVPMDPGDPGSALVPSKKDFGSDIRLKGAVERAGASGHSSPTARPAISYDPFRNDFPSAADPSGSAPGRRVGREAMEYKSDARSKRHTDGEDDQIAHFLESIHPKGYEYKSAGDDPMHQQGARRFGIIAQDADRDPVGHSMIEHTPHGLMVNIPLATSVLLASVADLNDRFERFEGGRRGRKA